MADFITEQWDADEKEILRENTAQTIQEQLERQDNLRIRYERRWIWELFQNALDASRNTPDLRIRILFDSSFVFAHNGAPFASKEILHLIFHGSTKRESAETIGRYGTGFLTTHVLSRKVQIRGQLRTGEYFDFALDRTGTTSAELMRGMEASRAQLVGSLSQSLTHSNWTEFEYPLPTSDARQLVHRTLSDLTRIAVAVIAFNPSLRSITVGGAIQGSYELLSEERLLDGCSILKIGDPQGQTKPQTVATATSGDLAVLLFLDDRENRHSILPPRDVPRIFVAFPLFGSESLPFPFVMNAPGAVPTEERNGLFLGADLERQTNSKNKSLVTGAWELYQVLIRVAAERHWGDLHQLAHIGRSESFDWLDTEWLNEILRIQTAEVIARQPIVETTSNVLLTPAASQFTTGVPDSHFAIFHELVEHLYGSSVVRADVAHQWKENIDSWHDLLLDSKSLEVTPNELLVKVSNIGTLQSLAESLPGAVDPIHWLNRFLDLLVECKENWADKNVLPDQLGRFTARKSLSSDRGVDENLKDIAELLAVGIRNELLDSRVTETIHAVLPAYDLEKLLGLLLNTIRIRKAKDYDAANVQLLQWLIKNQRSSEIKTYTFLLRALDSNGLATLSVISEPLLAPPEVWPSTAQPFVELFPSDHILASTYATLLSRDDWQYLSTQGLCHLDPLIRTSRLLGTNELSSMAQDVQAIETGDHSLPPIPVSDVAFLTLKDRGILDTARASKTRGARVLAFLFKHVVPNAASELPYNSVKCSCGNSHLVHSASWVVPLKERQWIYESRGHAVHVSAFSLARLLKEDLSLMRCLSDDSTLALLARLAISPSELHRATLDLPADQIAKLDKAVLELLAASNNDPQRLEEIADLVTSSPELLTEFEERKRRKERIRRNQQLGALVEELFRQLFSSPNTEALGLRLRRTGIGSDFAFESDFIDNDGQEQLFQLSTGKKELFVELKCTLGSSAKMTPTQAKHATANPNSFALCVVPLQDREPTLELVTTACRFVPTIGGLLQQKVAQVSDIEIKKAIATAAADGVQVSIEEGQLRYEILEPVWAAGNTASEFLRYLISFFSSEDAASAS